MSKLNTKFKSCFVFVFLFSSIALFGAPLTCYADQNSANVDGAQSATPPHIKAKALDGGGTEMDGGADASAGRNPSTTEGLPYPDEEVKSSDPVNPNSNKNMPVDQD